MNQAYGWFEGIKRFAPDKLDRVTVSVAKEVVVEIADKDETLSKKLQASLQEVGEHHQSKSVSGSTPPTALELGSLHPGVQHAAKQLFADGHYRSAVLDTSIALIDAVKAKSGVLNLDGVKLMQAVFSQNKPVLQCSESPDEQLGFMWLFSGAAMAIRNPRAHSLLFDERQAAIEWLTFMSALFRILDDTVIVCSQT